MENYSFPKEKWSNVNPHDFKYRGSGVEMLGEDDLFGKSEELLITGFLVKYSQSSMENDFNIMTAWLFVKRDQLKECAEKYPKIKQKVLLCISFFTLN